MKSHDASESLDTLVNKEDAAIVKDLNKKIEAIQEDITYHDEEISDHALIIVEAIYKFLRRNTTVQHIDLTHCQLTQVMVGRII